MANIFEFLSKDGNITPEKARKSRQMQFHDKTAYVWMGILPLKKRVNCDQCSFATKQRMFGVFAIDEILRYRGTWFPGSRTLCHPAVHFISRTFLILVRFQGLFPVVISFHSLCLLHLPAGTGRLHGRPPADGMHQQK